MSEHRTRWLAWMRKKHPEISEEDARRVVRINPGVWSGPSSCGDFTAFRRTDGFTGTIVYFDRDLQLVAMRTSTDVGSGNPACELWTHYGPAAPACDR